MSSAISVRADGRRTSSARYSSPPKLGRLPSSCESPRTLCPTDADAFAFKPDFIKNWTMDEELWKQLPANLQKLLTAVQHAGAAVNTGFERIHDLQTKLPEEPTTAALKDATASDAIAAKLHEHQARTFGRTRSYTKDPEEYNCSPIPRDGRNVSPFRSSQTNNSSGTDSTGWSPTAHMSPTSVMSPVSPQDSFSFASTPFELGEVHMPTISRRDSEIGMAKTSSARRDSDLFSSAMHASSSRRGSSQSVKKEAPRDPASSQYYAELEHLRKTCLVRLRHSARPVDIEWGVFKHNAPFAPSSDDMDVISPAKQLKDAFERWWLGKKRLIAKLDEAGKDLCTGIHFSLGWSDTPGLDDEHVELGI